MALSFSSHLLFLIRLGVSQGLFFASELREFSTVGHLGLLGGVVPEKMSWSEQPEQAWRIWSESSSKMRLNCCRRGFLKVEVTEVESDAGGPASVLA